MRYFEALRGGMGAFGVITSIKVKLMPTKAVTQTVHILSPYCISLQNLYFTFLLLFVCFVCYVDEDKMHPS